MPNELAYDPNLADNALVQPNVSPYQQPASYEDALQHLYSLTGIPDLLSAYQAANRGEYLPALGQGAAAGAAMLPALKPFALAPLALAMKGGKGAENALLGAASEVNRLMPIRAYHGSPYDFDKFELSKIGKGEGVQAYGHGLYFAEHPEVAEGYKRLLEQKLNPGRVYEVNINADPDQFLRWDKPLKEQQSILDLLTSSKKKLIKDMLSALDYMEPTRSVYGTDIGPVTGQDAYKLLSLTLEGRPTSPKASQTLNQAGIPGIRYLDQGSRGAGQGTSNYVVFDPKIVEILRKYGLLAPLAAAGLVPNE